MHALLLFCSIAVCVLLCLLLVCSIDVLLQLLLLCIARTYAVFIGKAPGVYSSWEEASAQVASYSNSSHREFKTRQGAEQAYSNWVRKHGSSSVDSGKVGGGKLEGGKVEGAKVDRQFGLKLKNFIVFAQFIVIVVLWRWCARCDHCR